MRWEWFRRRWTLAVDLWARARVRVQHNDLQPGWVEVRPWFLPLRRWQKASPADWAAATEETGAEASGTSVKSAAPPRVGGSGDGKGVVVSKQPGSAVGISGGGPAALAMSPAGGSNPGFGGSGGGEGIGRGNGPGGGFSGEGTGAGKTGIGKGSELNAHGGISPYPGPGGAGTATSGSPAVPGVSVRGGNNIVKLPSFSDGGSEPTVPGRASKGKENNGPGITVVASARSGGAFNLYGSLKGDKVYTIYIDTTLGPAVLQFADPSSAAHPYAADLCISTTDSCRFANGPLAHSPGDCVCARSNGSN